MQKTYPAGYGQPAHQPQMQMYGQPANTQPMYGQPAKSQPMYGQPVNMVPGTMQQQPQMMEIAGGNQEFSKASPPPCPHLVALRSDGDGELLMPLTSLKVRVEVHITVAAVYLEATFSNPTQKSKTCIFQLPCSEGAATVTGTTMRAGERQYETLVVSQDGGAPKTNNALVDKIGGFSGGNVGEYDPDMYRLPLNEFRAGESAVIEVEYLQDLKMNQNGEYVILIPMTVPPSMGQLGQNLSIDAVINTGTEFTQWGSSSHTLQVISSDAYRIVLKADPQVPQPNTDLVLSYSARSNQIKGSCIVQDPSLTDPKGSFCMFLSPPELGNEGTVFGRNIAFILDHSGSMYGEPMQSAKEALIMGLRSLNSNDFFAICAFDDLQEWISINEAGHPTTGAGPTLNQATPQNIEMATAWVSRIEARGLTDIFTPLQQARDMLNMRSAEETQQGYYPRLQISFVVTDGAVQNEKEICLWARDNAGDMRIYSFAIGPYANRYFLKMLAQLGRGYTDVCLYPKSLQTKMLDLMLATQSPVLTQVTVGLQVKDAEIYPFPIPDLFCGAPLTVTGQFTGQFPGQVVVRGKNCLGQDVQFNLQCFRKEEVPISKIFAKMQLDFLIANWWLAEAREQSALNAKVVESSCEHSIPCAFTQTVCYETQPAPPGEEKQKKKTNKGKFPKGAAIGGVVIVGAAIGAAVAFGSIAGTIDGSLVGDAMNAIGDGGMAAIDGIGDLFSGIDGDCCSGLNDICCFDIEGLCGGCGDCGGLGEIFGGCGEIFSGCGDCFSNLGEGLGGCCSSIGDVCDTDACSGLLDNADDICNSVGDLC
mmetsp:Transcript_13398/g.16879  ORF Transcript_13398/g.16879 Transcript_13398/m.16879 type:complete len:818 (+) Transcript_13398:241-2694(+)